MYKIMFYTRKVHICSNFIQFYTKPKKESSFFLYTPKHTIPQPIFVLVLEIFGGNHNLRILNFFLVIVTANLFFYIL